jgi:hypothetical protein
MAGQTTNYLFDYPTSTDYVKDGATAIETLADDVDATLFTALGGAYPGLRLVKKQTIGTAVSAVTVTDAFSATYENYFIKVTGGVASGDIALNMTLGATATSYYWAGTNQQYGSITVNGNLGSNVTNWPSVVYCSTNALSGQIFLDMPQTAKRTVARWQATGTSTTYFRNDSQGFLDNNTQYTAFTLTTGSGTITGGTIYVYGYGIS